MFVSETAVLSSLFALQTKAWHAAGTEGTERNVLSGTFILVWCKQGFGNTNREEGDAEEDASICLRQASPSGSAPLMQTAGNTASPEQLVRYRK